MDLEKSHRIVCNINLKLACPPTRPMTTANNRGQGMTINFRSQLLAAFVFSNTNKNIVTLDYVK